MLPSLSLRSSRASRDLHSVEKPPLAHARGSELLPGSVSGVLMICRAAFFHHLWWPQGHADTPLTAVVPFKLLRGQNRVREASGLPIRIAAFTFGVRYPVGARGECA
jgi:hypothetical protein